MKRQHFRLDCAGEEGAGHAKDSSMQICTASPAYATRRMSTADSFDRATSQQTMLNNAVCCANKVTHLQTSLCAV